MRTNITLKLYGQIHRFSSQCKYSRLSYLLGENKHTHYCTRTHMPAYFAYTSCFNPKYSQNSERKFKNCIQTKKKKSDIMLILYGKVAYIHSSHNQIYISYMQGWVRAISVRSSNPSMSWFWLKPFLIKYAKWFAHC